MVDTIRSRTELEDIFSDGKLRGVDGVTLQNVRDLIASLGVGGTMYANDVPFAVTSAWVPVTAFTNSIDTRGISDDLVTGEFVIGTGADGVFAVDIAIGISYPIGPSGWLEFAITKNGALTPYTMRRALTSGDEGSMSLIGSGNVVATDRIGLAVRANGNANVDLTSLQYRAIRG